MHYFSEVPEGQAIISNKGVYRQVPILTRKGRVYAKFGAGYVRLMQGGGTTHATVRWFEIDPGDGSITEGSGEVRYHNPVAVAAE